MALHTLFIKLQKTRWSPEYCTVLHLLFTMFNFTGSKQSKRADVANVFRHLFENDLTTTHPNGMTDDQISDYYQSRNCAGRSKNFEAVEATPPSDEQAARVSRLLPLLTTAMNELGLMKTVHKQDGTSTLMSAPALAPGKEARDEVETDVAGVENASEGVVDDGHRDPAQSQVQFSHALRRSKRKQVWDGQPELDVSKKSKMSTVDTSGDDEHADDNQQLASATFRQKPAQDGIAVNRATSRGLDAPASAISVTNDAGGATQSAVQTEANSSAAAEQPEPVMPMVYFREFCNPTGYAASVVSVDPGSETYKIGGKVYSGTFDIVGTSEDLMVCNMSACPRCKDLYVPPTVWDNEEGLAHEARRVEGFPFVHTADCFRLHMRYWYFGPHAAWPYKIGYPPRMWRTKVAFKLRGAQEGEVVKDVMMCDADHCPECMKVASGEIVLPPMQAHGQRRGAWQDRPIHDDNERADHSAMHSEPAASRMTGLKLDGLTGAVARHIKDTGPVTFTMQVD
ncbi:hypothetical protein B0A55_02292 [Friedmanniomyces simplex]|uniref:Uncharacterized protein n=1 Tax=Friedmanniomyces simplex TaxID=329884 RepID=A0A4U0XX56_9PEZI|nr:hypothetical protein B0A55_02292 [Friedmanniomyces simplex]